METNAIKVLVVEDVEIAQKIALYILSKLRCEVDIACNGKLALELISKKVYQLIFMDLGLPDIDGIIVTETIRTTENNNKSTPIVALTAHSEDQALKQECISAGMNEFLTKPLTLQKASEIINKFKVQVNSAANQTHSVKLSLKE